MVFILLLIDYKIAHENKKEIFFFYYSLNSHKYFLDIRSCRFLIKILNSILIKIKFFFNIYLNAKYPIKITTCTTIADRNVNRPTHDPLFSLVTVGHSTGFA